MIWTFLDPRMTPEHLGLIPGFLDDEDPRSAREQFDARYIGGWRPMPGHKLTMKNYTLRYPGDPPLTPLACTRLREELILFYDYAWVCVVQPDHSYEVCRMD